MKHNLILIAFTFWSFVAQSALAQTVTQFNIETRFGYELERVGDEVIDSNTGFKGQWLLFRIDGEINDGLTFSYRQRLNKNSNQTFWDATDWLHVDWMPTNRVSLSAGKQVVAIGGYEYDRAPINLYYCSEFWNNIPCYQFGVSASVNVTNRDMVMLQTCNSPFREWAGAGNNTYAINLIWYGRHGWWETMSSVNMFQYKKKDWINYISLGNRFKFSKSLHLDIDFLNRASSGQTFLLKDCSVVGELSYSRQDKLCLFAKCSYDVNHSGAEADLLVHDGTELSMASLGFEYNPIAKYREAFRIFGVGCYSFGTNSNPNGTMQDEQMRFEVGVKTSFNLLAALQKIIK